MSLSLLLALLVAAPPAERLGAEAERAIAAGRLVQARELIGRARLEGLGDSAQNRLLADLALAEGRSAEALALYRALLLDRPDDPALLAGAGRAAVRLGRDAEAIALLDRALSDEEVRSDWRVWNMRGVVSDRGGDFTWARAAYARALTLAPAEPLLLNNIGFSRMLEGDWEGAADMLSQAAALRPDHPRIAANYELVRAVLAGDLPRRRDGERAMDYAARLNDLGVAAALRGEAARARAAFTAALSAPSHHYARASRNLERLEGAE